jgi:hypothetical protein
MHITTVCDSPVALAIMRLLQCVASRGFSCKGLGDHPLGRGLPNP